MNTTAAVNSNSPGMFQTALLCILALSLSSAHRLAAQPDSGRISIRGQITNNILRERVAGAEVRVRHSNTDTTLTSGANGEWQLLLMRSTTGVGVKQGLPLAYELSANYPNPFNPSTKIIFTAPTAGTHNIAIYNVLGQELYFETKQLNPGRHVFSIDGLNASGVYFFRVYDHERSLTTKMVRLDGGTEANNISVTHSEVAGAFITQGAYSIGGKDNALNNTQNELKKTQNFGERDSIKIKFKALHHYEKDTSFVPVYGQEVNTTLEQIVYSLQSQVDVKVEDDGKNAIDSAKVKMYNNDNGSLIDSTITNRFGNARIRYVAPSVKNQSQEDVSLIKEIKIEAEKEGYEKAEKINSYSRDVSVTLNLESFLWINGFLEDTKTHRRQPGVIGVYELSYSPLAGFTVLDELESGPQRKRTKVYVKPIGEISVDVSGKFDRKFGKKVKDLTPYILIRGVRVENSRDTTSYIRTIKFPRGQIKNLELRVVGFDDLAKEAVSVDDFSRHVREVVYTFISGLEGHDQDDERWIKDSMNWNPIILKWDFGEAKRYGINPSSSFKEVIISKKSDLWPQKQRQFSYGTMDTLRRKILDSEDIGAWFRGKINDSTKVKITDFYDPWCTGCTEKDLEGRLFIWPSDLGSFGGSGDFFPMDGYIDEGAAWIWVNSNGDRTFGTMEHHEIGGHAGGQNGHAITLPDEKTMMKASFSIRSPSAPPVPTIDKKTSQEVIYEDSYQHGGRGSAPDGLLRVSDVLGRKWVK